MAIVYRMRHDPKENEYYEMLVYNYVFMYNMAFSTKISNNITETTLTGKQRNKNLLENKT